jgi:hypothetical protein
MWLASAHLWSKLTSVTAQRSSRWGGATAGVYAGQAVAPGMKTCPCRWIRPTASPRSRKWPRPLAVSPPRRPGSRWSACARPASVGRADGTPRGSSRSPDSSTPPSAPAARTRPVHPVPRRRRGRPLLRQRLRPRDRASPPLPAQRQHVQHRRRPCLHRRRSRREHHERSSRVHHRAGTGQDRRIPRRPLHGPQATARRHRFPAQIQPR